MTSLLIIKVLLRDTNVNVNAVNADGYNASAISEMNNNASASEFDNKNIIGVARNDFRDGLISIFIDNLSPSVASMGLWRFSKSFGKVRDVYLPSKKSLRGSRFGFIRFESAEEATNVAKKVNGMVVDSHPVSAKVALYGWNRRRSAVLRFKLVLAIWVGLPWAARSGLFFSRAWTGPAR
ncbi:hypothetical protein Dsin_002947 [Dipteronia sinensis]|uniref:RRM domain-containing protein n=1 Tax=Dipteronia sinensis TaxID=43782 RepID=A0AAE0EJW5_9ROSI|nr:hypothetical protein Dsin_002947 [Dipteronia sinensis]